MRPWMVAYGRRLRPACGASMGPRPCGRGWGVGDGLPVGNVELQWGHGLAAVDGRPCARRTTTLSLSFNGATALRPWMAGVAAGRQLPDARLQWGHGLAAVDGVKHRQGVQRYLGASMGPRPCGRGWPRRPTPCAICSRLQWGHGLAAVDGLATWPGPITATGFNGATALWPWMVLGELCTRLGRVLQWGHGLAAVDGRAAARLCGAGESASMGPRPCGRGWSRRLVATFDSSWASMGPRPCGRGWRFIPTDTPKDIELQWGHGLAAVDGCNRTRPVRRTGCFNGATALRPWMAARTPTYPCETWSFNGATALRPWMGELADVSAAVFRLQWGHGLAAVDGGNVYCGARGPNGASMGPRPCGRGWAPAFPGEPCAHWLQWGHGLAAVDGPPRDRRHGRAGGASMGPRPCGRGWLLIAAGVAAAAIIGFNGATALRPWMAAPPMPPPGEDEGLQWGHGLAAVDGWHARTLACL